MNSTYYAVLSTSDPFDSARRALQMLSRKGNGHSLVEFSGGESFSIQSTFKDPTTRAPVKTFNVTQGRLPADVPMLELSLPIGAAGRRVGLYRTELIYGFGVGGALIRAATKSLNIHLESRDGLDFLSEAAGPSGFVVRSIDAIQFTELQSNVELELTWEEYERFEDDDASLDFDYLISHFQRQEEKSTR
ncbi:MAG: hypothetical protein AAFX94_02855 [Myxococcota bacterium]